MRNRKSRTLLCIVFFAWMGLLSVYFQQDSGLRTLQEEGQEVEAQPEEEQVAAFDEESSDEQEVDFVQEEDQEAEEYHAEGEQVEESEEESEEDIAVEQDETESPEDVDYDNSVALIESSDDEEKPIMHTFYEPVGEGGCCGMTKEGHEHLLDAWKKAWEDAGWETKVLTKEDAMKHPDFEMLDERLKSRLAVTEYNRRCFWRWLAMASLDQPSGWMSDYDTFPLELTSERGLEIAAEDNSFKSYGLGVPCLIHASRDEWDRVIHLMMDNLPETRHDVGGLVTDMYTLQNVDSWHGRSDMKWSNDVGMFFLYDKDGEDGEVYTNCSKGAGKLAVHLSHMACETAWDSGLFPPVEDAEDKAGAVQKRANAAGQLMDDYRNHCVVTTE
uniref:Nucleotide-diphospho-sugar transferase domain-containing protein n=1 Tax=Chaetoceros debilis TaxID=122233 RepID=A0A6S8TE51_9STRA|eukprot:CAMPEP_0194116746 /NCGR_PEP_ID=MMETSP0150-20130528/28456_1 /TAXON_ID=122233 /ORGANISM="Chaetoceros debilis, Strain MM31A-1" /LENGTH=385 /DNA_ID=CAMNT_0038807543 /DNA_START=46 /DNA_END=1203 /DNA_ORIENTATION=+